MTSSSTPSYLRFPHLHGDLLTFVAEDDVWLAEIPAAGVSARAWRVTSDRAPVSRPRISPDGARIAWTSQRDGAPEAYSMPLEGGEADRLTFWGDALTSVRQWLSPDEIVVVTGATTPGRKEAEAYGVPTAGGVSRLLPYGVVQDLDVHGPAGAAVLCRGTMRETAWWKRYRGGTAGKLWLDPNGSGEFHRFLSEHEGNIGEPSWVDGRIAFTSDPDGVAELYSVLPDGTDLRRHSHDPAGFYARHAATDGTRVVFVRAGKLWLVDSLAADAEPRLLDIRLSGTRVGRATYPVAAAQHLGAFSPDRTGRASAVEVRGTVHWLTHKDGPARVLAAEAGVRNRLPVVLGESGSAAWITDAGGEFSLEIGSVDGSLDGSADGAANGAGAGSATGGGRRRILTGEVTRTADLTASPDGRHLAVLTEDNRLLVVDVETGTARVAASGESAGWPTFAGGPVFSPDSAWLAWSQASTVPAAAQIRLADVATLTAVDVTEPRFVDESPAFTLDGKHLVFLSARTFDPYYKTPIGGELGLVPGTRPYLVPLAADERSPFAPQLAGRPAGDKEKPGGQDESGKKDEKDQKDQKDQPPKTVVDVAGLTSRVVPFPVRAGNLSALRAVEGGVLWLESPVIGDLGDSLAGPSDEADRPALRRYDFAKREVTTLVDSLVSFEASGDGTRIVFWDGKTLQAQAADARLEAGAKAALDLDRIRVTVDPVADRLQSYREAWLLQRDFFWRADMSGVDWPAMYAKYEPVAMATAGQDDLVDVLWELQGELGTSHAYVRPEARSVESAKRQGLLGVDLDRDASGAWRIAKILPGDSSAPAARSPLEEPGVAALAGDVIVAVDGYPVRAEAGPSPLLAGKAGQPVALTLRRDGAEPRTVVVVPTGSEAALRYQAWVADRRAYVAEQSGGRLGYIHLPDQSSAGWAEFHRDMFEPFTKEGLVVDTRGNSGGNTSELISEKLLRKPLGWDATRGMTPGTYPFLAPRGPVVSVCDEFAGSDGDIINHVLKVSGVPVVGTRTWGGVVGIDGRFKLIDGTMVTQPKYAIWFNSVGFSVENYGVDPTVEVFQAPQDFVAGRDPQLDEAIRIVLEELVEHPAATPPERPWLNA